jgi:hypothetical protein
MAITLGTFTQLDDGVLTGTFKTLPVQKPSRPISDHPMPARAGSKEAAVPPILPRGMSALARAGLDSRATKSAPPRPAARRLRRP